MPTWEEAVRAEACQAAVEGAGVRLDADGSIPAGAPFLYRWEHIQLVVRNARWLLREVQADRDIVIAASWLHDICKGEPAHARRGAEFAAAFLPETDFPLDKIGAVAQAIRRHEGLSRPASRWRASSGAAFRPARALKPVEAALLWDADKLSKLGPSALYHYLLAMYQERLQRGERITTEMLHLENRHWLEVVTPRILASMNTAVAQRRGRQLQAAREQFARAMAEELEM